MKFKKLSKTDIDVSLICLGTMTWGEQNSQEEAFSQMNYSVDAGIIFLILLSSMPYPLKQTLIQKQKL